MLTGFSMITLLATAAAGLGSAQTAEPDRTPRPNIVLILADDLGITDITAYAQHFTGEPAESFFYETPHLNRLLRDGMVFSHAYATQLCSPTRAALMTGKLAPTLGFTTATPNTRTFYSAGLEPPQGVHPLNAFEHGDPILMEQPYLNAYSQTALPAGSKTDGGADEITIAEALEGYESVFLGKWHLGSHGAEGYRPDDQGFKSIAYYDSGGSPYFNWSDAWLATKLRYETMPQERLYAGAINGDATGEDYLTDDLTARAAAFISNRESDEPFFMYFAHFAVHTPIQGKQDIVARYAAKENLGVKGQRDPVYAAMLESLDDSIGALRDALAAAGEAENTYIILLSDNGGVDWRLKGPSPKIRPHHDMPISQNIPPTSNFPFTGGKATLFEGGVRVPFVIAGPGVPGGAPWERTPIDVTDVFPTILELAGQSAAYHYQRDGFFGRSLAGFWDNNAAPYDKNAMYWHYPFNVIVPDPDDSLAAGPHSAIRQGDYKLIYDWHGQVRLFDVVNDPFEREDLVDKRRDLARDMLADLKAWITANVAPEHMPRLDPSYDPTQDPRGPVSPPWVVPALEE